MWTKLFLGIIAVNTLGVSLSAQDLSDIPRHQKESLGTENQRDAESLRRTAGHYYSGGAVTRDLEKALQIYREAADLGDSLSMRAIGRMYGRGEGTERDLEKALTWYRRAYDAGLTEVCEEIVDLRLAPSTPVTDLAKGVEWAKRGAAVGDPASMNLLGQLYRVGMGVEEDRSKGILWTERAGNAGDLRACLTLGYTAHDEGDIQVASSWFSKALAIELHDDAAARLWLCLVALDERETADAHLEEYVDATSGGGFTGQVLRFLARDLSWNDLIAKAKLEDKGKAEQASLAMAHFYVGCVELLNGNTRVAKEHFETGSVPGACQSTISCLKQFVRLELGR